MRTWTDASGLYTVDATFLGVTYGKIQLHKANGVKIAVPVGKISVVDRTYVARAAKDDAERRDQLCMRHPIISPYSLLVPYIGWGGKDWNRWTWEGCERKAERRVASKSEHASKGRICCCYSVARTSSQHHGYHLRHTRLQSTHTKTWTTGLSVLSTIQQKWQWKTRHQT